jgi:UV excision repair protein RAD23
MKITIKTLQQKVFQIDAEESETVGDLKKKIQDTHGHIIESQKLIYSGKVLPDSKSIESCAIKEKDFLVLMVSKPKPTPSASTSTTAAAATSNPAPVAPAVPPAPAAVAASPALDSSSPTAPVAAVQTETAPAFGDTSSFVSGSRLQTTIDNMMEMGFERDQVMRALRASFNNPDRAVEYLMNGIPAHLETEAAQQAAAQSPQGGAAPPPVGAPVAQPAAQPVAAPPPNQPQNLFQLAQQRQQQQQQAPPAAGAAAGGIDINAMRDSPQIQQLREMIRQNPALMQPLIQQLAASNPGIAQAVAQNPEALFQLLGSNGEDGEGALPPGTQFVNVTEEEQAAIERLEALGFPRQAAIEAYFACDKNEELAANYLFESGFED